MRDELNIQFPTTPVKSDPLSYMLKQVANVDPRLFRVDSFAEAFPNLSTWGEHYGSLKLSDLDIVLGEQSKKSTGELEIFGAKIPNELVALIGIPSLILLLLQFISTAGYLLRTVDPINVEQASQWSLMLKGFGFFLFGFSTTFILPISASVGTVTFATPETWYRIPVWCSLTTFLCILSLVALLMLDMLRRRVKYDDVPKSESTPEEVPPDRPNEPEKWI
jgi:hypothetical protein